MRVDFNKHLPEPWAQHSRPADRLQSPSCCGTLSLARAGLERPSHPGLCLQPQAAPLHKWNSWNSWGRPRGKRPHQATLVLNRAACASTCLRAYNPHEHVSTVFAKPLQSRPTLCDPVDRSPPGFSAQGFSRQEHWSGLPCPPPGHFPHPGTEPFSLKSPALAGGFFTTSRTWEALCVSHVCV